MPLRNFGQKRQLQYLEKYAMLSRVFKFVMKYIYQFSSLFWGNFFAYAIELIEFKLLFANSSLFTPQGKIYNAREITVSFKTNNLKGFIGAS